jgi:hypothetical protein
MPFIAGCVCCFGNEKKIGKQKDTKKNVFFLKGKKKGLGKKKTPKKFFFKKKKERERDWETQRREKKLF